MIHDKKNILSVYFTAGYPNLGDTGMIIKTLQKNGVELIEVGMPYSDPMADGKTIQESSAQALQNGMTLDLLFDQLTEIKSEVKIPLVFMGYLNQWMQYGVHKFCERAKSAGISGLIIPDLPLDIYEQEFKNTVEKNGLSRSSITGGSHEFTDEQIKYFNRIKEVSKDTPRMIGFGINSASSFKTASSYANGAIIGSGFIRALKKENVEKSIEEYIQSILN